MTASEKTENLRKFPTTLAAVNPVDLLTKHDLDRYTVEENYDDFKIGLTTATLHAPINEGEVINGQALFDRSAKIKGKRTGLIAFLSFIEDAKSIPTELRDKVYLVCEAVLVEENGGRCLLCARWLIHYGWVVNVDALGLNCRSLARVVRFGE